MTEQKPPHRFTLADIKDAPPLIEEISKDLIMGYREVMSVVVEKHHAAMASMRLDTEYGNTPHIIWVNCWTSALVHELGHLCAGFDDPLEALEDMRRTLQELRFQQRVMSEHRHLKKMEAQIKERAAQEKPK